MIKLLPDGLWHHILLLTGSQSPSWVDHLILELSKKHRFARQALLMWLCTLGASILSLPARCAAGCPFLPVREVGLTASLAPPITCQLLLLSDDRRMDVKIVPRIGIAPPAISNFNASGGSLATRNKEQNARHTHQRKAARCRGHSKARL